MASEYSAPLTTEQLKDLLAKVTPGEWIAYFAEDRPGIEAEDCTIVCFGASEDDAGVYGPDANATLIALAPTLAAEVVRLRGDLDRIANLHCGWGDSAIDTMHDMIRIARQALDGTSAG